MVLLFLEESDEGWHENDAAEKSQALRQPRKDVEFLMLGFELG